MTDRPNIIWVFDDQHRAQATSLAGDPNVATPHIDRLAEQGVWFRSALSGNPWCTPFRGSLLTGRYSHNAVYETPSRLDPAIPTIADAFNDGGYDTAYFGKWHLARQHKTEGPVVNGHIDPCGYWIPPELRGRFKQWLGYESCAKQYDMLMHGHDATGQEIPMRAYPGYEPDAFTDLLIDYLRGDRDQPFFAVCSIQPPHNPYNPPPEYAARFDPANIELRPNVPDVGSLRDDARKSLAAYYGSIACMDDNLGRIMQTLHDTGQYDNTYVIFFSDHGDMHNSQGLHGKSVPYEESIRIPFIIGGGAAMQAAGRVSDSLLNSVDIAPTTLGLAGLQPREAMPGFDYSAFVTDATFSGAGELPGKLPGEPDSAYCQHVVPKRHGGGMDCTWRAVVTRDGWKYICTENAGLGMYDLNIDPCEQHNLVYDHAHRGKRAELLARLTQWMNETGDTYPLPKPAESAN